MEIGGAAMQRMAATGGPGPLSLQGPPRSVKISPVNIQDEPGDLTSQKITANTEAGESSFPCYYGWIIFTKHKFALRRMWWSNS